MSKIKQMDELLANKIAAGEVVERCASVVKELVENSIDALSTEIKINLLESGVREITVIDDGIGMDKEDALLAFSSHATSKIKDEDDLFHITTLGFRGEALPSIASVSNVKLETCDGEKGTLVEISGGTVKNVQTSIARRGTKITVSNLFFNTPARLKHMKSLYTELASITDYVNKIALSFPNIKFVLTNDGNTLLNTDGSGNLLKVIKSIYGIETVKKMLEVSASDDDYEITGYISKPEVHRSSRNTMITLVNGRVVRNQELNRCINDAYHSYKPDNRYPIVVLNIKTDPTLVDVNVHPTKMDIKFSKMNELLELTSKMIREKISGKVLIPSLDSDLFHEEYQVNDDFKISEPIPYVFEKEEKPKYEIQSLKFEESVSEEEINYESIKEEIEDKKTFPTLKYVGVIHSTYIVCQDETGMYLMDQHAAKERVNYELFKKKLGNPNVEIERLLFPITIELSANEYIVLRENFNVLENMGIEVEDFGINSIIVKSHPTWIPKEKAEESIKQIVELIISLEDKFDIEKFNEASATMLACKLAIKANQYVSEEEINKLLIDLKQCKNPYNCPHGRPTIVFYSNYELEKMFKRSGFNNFSVNK